MCHSWWLSVFLCSSSSQNQELMNILDILAGELVRVRKLDPNTSCVLMSEYSNLLLLLLLATASHLQVGDSGLHYSRLWQS